MKVRVGRGNAGFTLMEILVVIAIIGLFATMAISYYPRHLQGARVERARADLVRWEQAAEEFFLENGFYPSTDQGLRALVERPTTGRVPKRFPPRGYVKRPAFDDPWGQPYLYQSPGTYGDIDVFTLGADGAPGGAGLLLFGVTEAEIPIGACFLNVFPVLPLSIPLLLSGTGEAVLNATFPPGVSSGLLTMQAVVVDPAAPFGAVGSNGLALRVP